MSRRNCQDFSVSLFAFQDIITSVFGIFFLLLIALVLQIATSQAIQSQSTDDDALQAELAVLEARLAKHNQTSPSQPAAVNPILLQAKLVAAEERVSALSQQILTTNRVLQGISGELAEARGGSDRVASELDAAQSQRDQLAALVQQAEQLQRERQALESTDPWVYRSRAPNGRLLRVLVVNRDGAELLSNQPDQAHRWTSQQLRGDWLADIPGSDSGSLHLLLLVCPGGAQNFERMAGELERNHINYGFDVISADQEILVR